MANTDKDILITPNRGQNNDPKVDFVAANANAGPHVISLYVYTTDNGTLSFEGSAGQLFSITNNLTGTIFSVNDISGIPSLEINADGNVTIAEFSGNIHLGNGSSNANTFINTALHVLGPTYLGNANNVVITGGTSGYVLSTNGSGGLSWVAPDSGATGVSGFSGYSGRSGYSGFSGISGYSGRSGFSGFSGISGFSGAVGATGGQGIQGISGFSGYSGRSGFSGFSGAVGTSGFSGISGYSGPSGVVTMATTADIRAGTGNVAVPSVGVTNALAWVALTDSATVAVNGQSAVNFTLVLGGNRTLGNMTNPVIGRTYIIEVQSNSGTARTLTLASNYVPTTGLSLSGITNAAGSRLLLSILVKDSTTMYVSGIRV